ncbi:hypothetical protein Q8A67_001541 [Cirrhinus molitorella]|uniref:Uncharacterized protein n=1 Tax=Cirrhinus molitorella TaxID=172907 RepID=A0AA88TXV4_9TELE|nr:hypothetical protein Q8A67_001541 [Cirrhinus molitorella]
MDDIISVLCAEIRRTVGFLYENHTNNPDCDQSWYSENRLIADPSHPQILIDPAISVSSDRLVTSRCVNLIHKIICHSADGTPFRLEIEFRVRNETAVTPNSDDLYTVTPDLQPTGLHVKISSGDKDFQLSDLFRSQSIFVTPEIIQKAGILKLMSRRSSDLMKMKVFLSGILKLMSKRSSDLMRMNLHLL